MKIDSEIFYKLYYSTLDLKIQHAEEDLEVFKLTFNNIKAILKTYKPYIIDNVSINYNVLLVSPSYQVKGKLAERYVYEDKLYTKEAFYSYLKNYKRNFDRIKKHKEYIESLKRKKISYRLYKKITKKFNLKIAFEIVFRQYIFNMQYGLGKLFIVRKIANKDKINWDASNKVRDELIVKDQVPYYKQDYEEALKEGKQYKGIKWLRYHPRENVWIHHQMVQVTSYKFQLVKSNITKSLKYFLTQLRGSKDFNPKKFPLLDK